MELVGAPVNELRTVLTTSFEDWARMSATRAITSSCALSGGATALIFLGALRNANVDWKRITLFWADERAVAPDDPESNYGLAERMAKASLPAATPATTGIAAAMSMPESDTRVSEAAQKRAALVLIKNPDHDKVSLAARSKSPNLKGLESQRQPVSSRKRSASVPATSPVTKITRRASVGVATAIAR